MYRKEKGFYEADISTFQKKKSQYARVPCAESDKGRKNGVKKPPRKEKKEADRIPRKVGTARLIEKEISKIIQNYQAERNFLCTEKRTIMEMSVFQYKIY